MHDLLKIYDENNHFGRLMGMSYRENEPGMVEYKLKIEKEHLALGKNAHGGAVAAFMDAILGLAGLSSVCREDKFVATVEFKINFLSSAELHDQLVGLGKVVQKGKRLLVIEGEIKCGDRLVATASGTFTAYPASKLLPGS